MMNKLNFLGDLHPLIPRLVVFLLLMLIAFQAIFSLFLPNNDFFYALLIGKFLWLSAIAVSLFAFLAIASGKSLPLLSSKKQSIYLLIASLVLFSASSFPISDFEGVLCFERGG